MKILTRGFWTGGAINRSLAEDALIAERSWKTFMEASGRIEKRTASQKSDMTDAHKRISALQAPPA